MARAPRTSLLAYTHSRTIHLHHLPAANYAATRASTFTHTLHPRRCYINHAQLRALPPPAAMLARLHTPLPPATAPSNHTHTHRTPSAIQHQAQHHSRNLSATLKKTHRIQNAQPCTSKPQLNSHFPPTAASIPYSTHHHHSSFPGATTHHRFTYHHPPLCNSTTLPHTKLLSPPPHSNLSHPLTNSPLPPTLTSLYHFPPHLQ